MAMKSGIDDFVQSLGENISLSPLRGMAGKAGGEESFLDMSPESFSAAKNRSRVASFDFGYDSSTHDDSSSSSSSSSYSSSFTFVGGDGTGAAGAASDAGLPGDWGRGRSGSFVGVGTPFNSNTPVKDSAVSKYGLYGLEGGMGGGLGAVVDSVVESQEVYGDHSEFEGFSMFGVSDDVHRQLRFDDKERAKTPASRRQSPMNEEDQQDQMGNEKQSKQQQKKKQAAAEKEEAGQAAQAALQPRRIWVQ